ncbi:aromatic motif membrane protein [Metamycoplasma equirhinis]|uniref:aromatic motif membrane protein n=1 Tax=Metamycoplasma equirhinis TaxID=92402 RepID=UPI0035943ACF
MKANKKIIILPSLILPLLPPVSISCANTNANLQNLIDKKGDIIDNVDKNIETKKQFIQTILNSLYDSNLLKMEQYINSLPKTKEQINHSINSLAREMKKHEDKKVVMLQEWLSKNWLLFFENMDKFNLIFDKWISPNPKEGKDEFNKIIAQYSNKVSKLEKYSETKIEGNTIDSSRVAEWSQHTYKKSNYYVGHKNIVFEFYIDLNKNEIVFNPFVWYFQNTKENISLGTIDTIYHSCWLHHSEHEFVNGFEGKLVKKYGHPASMLLIPKGDN